MAASGEGIQKEDRCVFLPATKRQWFQFGTRIDVAVYRGEGKRLMLLTEFTRAGGHPLIVPAEGIQFDLRRNVRNIREWSLISGIGGTEHSDGGDHIYEEEFPLNRNSQCGMRQRKIERR